MTPKNIEEKDNDGAQRPQKPRFLRRKAAAVYLTEKYGFGAARSLAKLAVTGGGPEFHKAGSHIVLYSVDALDEWALAKIGAARRSTSAHQNG